MLQRAEVCKDGGARRAGGTGLIRLYPGGRRGAAAHHSPILFSWRCFFILRVWRRGPGPPALSVTKASGSSASAPSTSTPLEAQNGHGCGTSPSGFTACRGMPPQRCCRGTRVRGPTPRRCGQVQRRTQPQPQDARFCLGIGLGTKSSHTRRLPYKTRLHSHLACPNPDNEV